MNMIEFKEKVKKEYGSINKYCEVHEADLKDAGISRATFYRMYNGEIKNYTKNNFIAFSKITEIPLEEVTNVFVIGYRDTESTN